MASSLEPYQLDMLDEIMEHGDILLLYGELDYCIGSIRVMLEDLDNYLNMSEHLLDCFRKLIKDGRELCRDDDEPSGV